MSVLLDTATAGLPDAPADPSTSGRPPTGTGRPWCCASRPSTRRARRTPKNPHHGTSTARRRNRICRATWPRSRSARRASGARRRSSRRKGPSGIGSAGTTARTPPTPTGTTGSPVRAPCGCPTARGPVRTVTAVEGTGPGPASTPHPDPIHRGGRWAAAPVGGRRDITRATTEAVGGGDARPGGNQSSRSDCTSSGHTGGAAGLSGRRGARGESRPCSTLVRRTALSVPVSPRRTTCAPRVSRAPHRLNCGNGGVARAGCPSAALPRLRRHVA